MCEDLARILATTQLTPQTFNLADALELARAHRVSVAVDGGRLIFVGADRPRLPTSSPASGASAPTSSRSCLS